MEEIKTIENGELGSLPMLQMTKTRLIIPEGTTFEEWQKMGKQIKILEGAIQWWIGDWINFGEKHYGEKYLTAVQVTGFSLQYLRDQAWVASRTSF